MSAPAAVAPPRMPAALTLLSVSEIPCPSVSAFGVTEADSDTGMKPIFFFTEKTSAPSLTFTSGSVKPSSCPAPCPEAFAFSNPARSPSRSSLIVTESAS